jgi:hypothetical protein
MKTRFFELFTGMLEGLPAKGILRFVEREQGMLDEDLILKRVPQNREITSVLSFCHFLRAAACGGNFYSVELPADHVAIYRKIVVRMIQAGELTGNAKDKFDQFFCREFFKRISC